MGKLRHLALVTSAIAGLACAAGLGLGSVAHASTTIINFGQVSGSNTVTATNNGAGVTTIDISDAAALVTQFLGGGTPFAAWVDLSATSNDVATAIGPAVLQHYDGTFCITSATGCGGTNYLSGSFSDALFGTGNQLSVNVSNPPDALTFTSDIIAVNDLGAPSGLGFTFTNVTPSAGITGGSVASFTASFTGNASASAVPETSTWAMLALGFAGLGYAGFHRNHKTAISIA